MTIDITGWRPDVSYGGIFPVGARPKRVVYCDDASCCDKLVVGKKYLFKKSFDRYPEQFWMEKVAEIVGKYMNVPVPNTFISVDNATGECGALIEWFYDETSPDFIEYIDGTSLFVARVPDFDIKTGAQHDIATILLISKSLSESECDYITDRFILHFSRMMIFDSLIGNTDRHQENWGLIYFRLNDKQRLVRYSPAFDNGTSLGHEIVQRKFVNFEDKTRLNQYIQKGCHHVRWKAGADRIGHMEFIESVSDIDTLREQAIHMLDFNFESLRGEIENLTELNAPVRFTDERAMFTVKLLETRYKIMAQLIGEAK